jgi:hypothetical protein
MTRRIEILVSPTGTTTVKTMGFAGPACRDASKFIQQALGVKMAETLTAEFHEVGPVSQQNRQRA